MHPHRNRIISRLILSMLIVLGAVVWILFFAETKKALRPRRTVAVQEISKLNLPSADDRQKLHSAIGVMNDLAKPNRTVPIHVAAPELIDPEKSLAGTDQHQIMLSLLFFSRGRRAAVINNIPYFEGSALPDGSVLLRIDHQGVILEADGNVERVPWTLPERVEFLKAPPLELETDITKLSEDEKMDKDQKILPSKEQEAEKNVNATAAPTVRTVTPTRIQPVPVRRVTK